MKKINILSTILAIGMLLGLASCDLDNNKNSPSLELDDDAVALVNNFIYVTPETKGNKGFKITLLYNDENPGFWDSNRYVKIEVSKVVDIRAAAPLSLQAEIDVGGDNQRPTAEDPVKVIYFPFVEAGESYVFKHNTNDTQVMEALCGAGEIHSFRSPSMTYWNDGYKRLVKVNTTNKAIDACMDDVTIPYELRYGFGIETTHGSNNYTWITGQDTIDGDHPFFKDLLTSDGADILSDNQVLYITKAAVDAAIMEGSSALYYQDHYTMRLVFDVSALLDADTYGNCMYKFIATDTGWGQNYYSKNTYVKPNNDGFEYTDTWNGLTRTWKYNQYNNLEKCTATDTWNDLTRTWWFNANGTFNECNAYDDWNSITRKWSFDSAGAFLSSTVDDSSYVYPRTYYFNEDKTFKECIAYLSNRDNYYDESGNFLEAKSVWTNSVSVQITTNYTENGSFISSSGTDIWNGLTRTWVYDSSDIFVSCTAEDGWNGMTRTWKFNSSGNFVSCTAQSTWNGLTKTYEFDSNGLFKTSYAKDDDYIYYFDASENFTEKKSYWKVSNNSAYQFVQNGDIWTSNNQGKHGVTASTTFSIYLDVSTSVSIPWTVSSESGYDKLTIKLDDVTKVDGVSGIKNGTITETLTAGTHTLTVQYYKDGSVNDNDDCATVTLVPVP